MSTLQKRAISIFLCLLMIVGATVVAVPVGAATSDVMPSGTPGGMVAIATGEKMGYRFNTLHAFSNPKIQIHTNAVFGTESGLACEIELYKWNANYATTTASAPLDTKTVTSNESDYFATSANPLIPLTAASYGVGDYLIVVKNTGTAALGFVERTDSAATTSAGYWYDNAGNEYKNGKKDIKILVNVEMDNATSADVYGTCEPSTGLPTWNNSETYAPESFYNKRIAVTATQTQAYRFETLIPFKNLKLQITDFSGTVSVTLALYEWKGTYEATVSGDAIAENTYQATGTVAIGDATTVHPAGGYLIVCTTTADGTDNKFNIVANTDHSFLYGSTYIDGVQQPSEYDWRINFTVPDGYKVTDRKHADGIAAIFKVVEYVAPVESLITYSGFQPSANMSGASFDLRFVATIDRANLTVFQKVGFKVKETATGRTWTVESTKVYEALTGEYNGEYQVVLTADADEYIVAVAITGIPTDLSSITGTPTELNFEVVPFIIDSDGKTIYEQGGSVTYKEGAVN